MLTTLHSWTLSPEVMWAAHHYRMRHEYKDVSLRRCQGISENIPWKVMNQPLILLSALRMERVWAPSVRPLIVALLPLFRASSPSLGLLAFPLLGGEGHWPRKPQCFWKLPTSSGAATDVLVYNSNACCFVGVENASRSQRAAEVERPQTNGYFVWGLLWLECSTLMPGTTKMATNPVLSACWASGYIALVQSLVLYTTSRWENFQKG